MYHLSKGCPEPKEEVHETKISYWKVCQEKRSSSPGLPGTKGGNGRQGARWKKRSTNKVWCKDLDSCYLQAVEVSVPHSGGGILHYLDIPEAFPECQRLPLCVEPPHQRTGTIFRSGVEGPPMLGRENQQST